MQPDLFHPPALSTNIPCRWVRSDLKFAYLSSETKGAIKGYIPRTYPEVYCSHQRDYAFLEMFQIFLYIILLLISASLLILYLSMNTCFEIEAGVEGDDFLFASLIFIVQLI